MSDWENKFDEKGDFLLCDLAVKAIKSFIRTLLEEEYAKGYAAGMEEIKSKCADELSELGTFECDNCEQAVYLVVKRISNLTKKWRGK